MGYVEEIEKLPIGVLLCAKDEKITILNANSVAYQILGYSPNDLRENHDNKLCNIIADDIKDLFNDIANANGEIFEYDIQLKTKLGDVRWMHNVTNYDVQNSVFYVIISDVTEEVMSSQIYVTLEKKLEEQRAVNVCLEALHDTDSEKLAMNKLMTVLLQHYSADSVFIFNPATEEVAINVYELVRDEFGAGVESVNPFSDSFYELLVSREKDSKDVVLLTCQGCFDTDKELHDVFKQYEINKLLFAPIVNRCGGLLACVGVVNPEKSVSVVSLLHIVSNFIADYIDKAKIFAQMHELSYSDSLTKLKNRHSYILKLEEVQKKHPGLLGVSYIDLNGLKIANDTQGHEFGDKLITSLSAMLKKHFGAEVYRVGGDEFIALCENISREDFEAKNQQLKFDMKEDAILDASIGFFWSDDKMDVNSQLEMAENLMYIEKQHYYEVNEITRKGKK